MRNGNLLKSHVSEIHVKRIRVYLGVGVLELSCMNSKASRSGVETLLRFSRILCGVLRYMALRPFYMDSTGILFKSHQAHAIQFAERLRFSPQFFSKFIV